MNRADIIRNVDVNEPNREHIVLGVFRRAERSKLKIGHPSRISGNIGLGNLGKVKGN